MVRRGRQTQQWPINSLRRPWNYPHVEYKKRVMMYYAVSAGYCTVQASAILFAASSGTALCEFLRHDHFSLQCSSSPNRTHSNTGESTDGTI